MKNRRKHWRSAFAVVGVPLLIAAALVGAKAQGVSPQSEGYSFTKIASLGDAAPTGGTFVNDFETGGLNSSGDMAFGADVSTGGEGVFLRHKGEIIELGRTGGQAPGLGQGGVPLTFSEFGFLGPVGLNDEGDEVFAFLLDPFTQPLGANAGTYRYSHTNGKVTPVVIPYVTPAPQGDTFQGVSNRPTINNRGDVVFAGIVITDHGVHNVPDNGEPYIGLGIGIFRSDSTWQLTSVVSPGDAAPGGGNFDFAFEPWVNNAGDVSFTGHIAGEESRVASFPPQAEFILALGSLYVKNGGTGTIRSIAHAGDPAPGGGKFRRAFQSVMNNRGQIAFRGDLTAAPGINQSIGVFLYSGDEIRAIARPGDSMPGGGKLVNPRRGDLHINDRGDIVFGGVVDTDVDHDGFDDTGLFQWSHGRLSLIARTGTVIPGVGTVSTTSGAINNNRGQVIFQATLTDGSGVFLLATPHD
jgi:hypothetical protein